MSWFILMTSWTTPVKSPVSMCKVPSILPTKKAIKSTLPGIWHGALLPSRVFPSKTFPKWTQVTNTSWPMMLNCPVRMMALVPAVSITMHGQTTIKRPTRGYGTVTTLINKAAIITRTVICTGPLPCLTIMAATWRAIRSRTLSKPMAQPLWEMLPLPQRTKTVKSLRLIPLLVLKVSPNSTISLKRMPLTLNTPSTIRPLFLLALQQ